MCRLQHPELLDAAHIIGDREEHGAAEVSNGISLCKIHHSAYDQNFIGVRPDLVIEVRQDLLDEIDGPMLRHGIQELAGQLLVVPARPSARPDRERLDERYELFLAAS